RRASRAAGLRTVRAPDEEGLSSAHRLGRRAGGGSQPKQAGARDAQCHRAAGGRRSRDHQARRHRRTGNRARDLAPAQRRGRLPGHGLAAQPVRRWPRGSADRATTPGGAGGMSNALVSIVLPTHNRCRLLPYAIRSVLAQTHTQLELIVVDDNSKDATPEIVRSFHDGRVRYVRNERNLKLPGALNRGFALAEGRFLTWTSDDNLYAPEAIARMVAALEEATCDFVFADYFDFARHDERTGEPLRPRRIRLPDQLKLDERNSVGACFLYTRAVCEAVGAYDTDLFLVEDYDYFIRVAQAGFRIRHLPEALYYFSRHDDSLFCARYAEVKSADVLVRYKNGLLDKRRAASACVD